MPDAVHELLATDAALGKLAARSISVREASQTLRNRPEFLRHVRGRRRLLVGVTDGGRALTLVVERTLDPTTWLLITGWETTAAERKMVGR
jgi:hypothetical protein